MCGIDGCGWEETLRSGSIITASCLGYGGGESTSTRVTNADREREGERETKLIYSRSYRAMCNPIRKRIRHCFSSRYEAGQHWLVYTTLKGSLPDRIVLANDIPDRMDFPFALSGAWQDRANQICWQVCPTIFLAHSPAAVRLVSRPYIRLCTTTDTATREYHVTLYSNIRDRNVTYLFINNHELLKFLQCVCIRIEIGSRFVCAYLF